MAATGGGMGTLPPAMSYPEAAPAPVYQPAPLTPAAALSGNYPPPPSPPQPAPPTEFAPAPPTPGGELLLPEDKQIRDPIVLETIADGIRLRTEGDAQGALTQFRAAAAAIGDNPVVLAELGRTYEIMDLEDKAIASWEKIYAMGDAGAGDYYVMADARLRGLRPERRNDRGPGSILGFAPVTQEIGSDPQRGEGETILLRVPIRREAEGVVLAEEVSIYVYFYDKVNGDRIEQSTADPPESAWRTLPIDWETVDPEIFEIVYHHPALTPQEVRELGRRRYFGYVLKLYYQDRLQDIIAEPRLLLDHAPASTLPQIDDILFR